MVSAIFHWFSVILFSNQNHHMYMYVQVAFGSTPYTVKNISQQSNHLKTIFYIQMYVIIFCKKNKEAFYFNFISF
jgi:hypothetical protein